MSKKSTIYDVAKISGVSPATISRVINQPGLVAEETKEKVYSAMDQLGYTIKATIHENIIPLAGGLIIVNLPTLDNPFYGEIIKGIKASADRYNCDVLVSAGDISSASLDEFKALVKKIKPLGIITTSINDPELIINISRILPTVQCCECCENINVPSVSVNDYSAAFAAVEYLCERGKKRIAFINGPLEYKGDRDRLLGYQDALTKNGIPLEESLVTSLPYINYSIAVSAVSQMLSRENTVIPDAIFASSDVYAIAAIRAAHLNSYSIPDDISIIGFDNIEVASINVPALTTINQPRIQLGFSACDLLFERILHPNYPIKHMILDAEMIIREST